MNPNFLALFFSLFLIITLGCSDSPPEEEENTIAGLPSHMIIDDSFYIKVEWDDSSRVSAYKLYLAESTFLNDHPERQVEFEYDDQGQILRTNYSADGELTLFGNYHYSQGQLDSIVTDGDSNTLYTWHILSYDTNGNCGPIRTESFSAYQSEDQRIKDKTETWQYSSTCDEYEITRENFSMDTLTSTYTGQYIIMHDDFLNEWPIRNMPTNHQHHEYTKMPASNILSLQLTNADGSLNDSSFESIFEYQTNNRLKSETRTYATGVQRTYSFYYN